MIWCTLVAFGTSLTHFGCVWLYGRNPQGQVKKFGAGKFGTGTGYGSGKKLIFFLKNK